MSYLNAIIIIGIGLSCVGVNVDGKLINCTVDESHAGREVNEDAFFSGVWHIVSATDWIWGNNTWVGGKLQLLTTWSTSRIPNYTGRKIFYMPRFDVRIFRHNVSTKTFLGSLATYSYTKRKSEEKCSPVIEMNFVPDSGKPGFYALRWKLRSNPEKEILGYAKIIYTDYYTAVLHECLGSDNNGSCLRDMHQISFLSRKSRISEAIRRRLHGLVSDLCVTLDDMPAQNEAECFLNEELEATVMEAAENSTSSCRVTEIPVSPVFTFDMLFGFWHHTAITQFTSYPKLDSGMSYYVKWNTDASTNTLTGAINGTCLEPVVGLTIHDASSTRSGDLLGKLGGYSNTYAWFPFRVLFADSDNILVYACYGQNEMGVCDHDTQQVELMSRQQTLTDAVLKRMRGYMPRVCLTPEDLQRAPFTAVEECKRKLFEHVPRQLNVSHIPLEYVNLTVTTRLPMDADVPMDTEDEPLDLDEDT